MAGGYFPHRYFPARYFAPRYFGPSVAPAETITLDKWANVPQPNPARRKDERRLYPSFFMVMQPPAAEPFATTGTALGMVAVAGNIIVYPRRRLFQAKAQPVDTPAFVEEITLDKWTHEPVRRVAARANRRWLALDAAEPILPPTVVVVSTNNVRLAKTVVVLYQARAEPLYPLGTIQWAQPANQPPAKRANRRWLAQMYAVSAYALTQPEAPQLDKWVPAWSEPQRRRANRRWLYDLAERVDPTILLAPEATQVDKWYVAQTLPARRRARGPVREPWFYVGDPTTVDPPAVEDVTVDKWYALSQSPRRFTRRALFDDLVLVTLEVADTQWLVQQVAPVARRLRAQFEPLAQSPLSLLDAAQVGGWQALPTLPVRKRAARQSAGVALAVMPPPVTPLDTWWTPVSTPTTRKAVARIGFTPEALVVPEEPNGWLADAVVPARRRLLVRPWLEPGETFVYLVSGGVVQVVRIPLVMNTVSTGPFAVSDPHVPLNPNATAGAGSQFNNAPIVNVVVNSTATGEMSE